MLDLILELGKQILERIECIKFIFILIVFIICIYKLINWWIEKNKAEANKFVKKHRSLIDLVLLLGLYLFVVIVMLFFIVPFRQEFFNRISNFIHNSFVEGFLKVFLLVAIYVFGRMITGFILKKTEDPCKLLEDYEKILNKYKNVNYVTTKNGNRILVDKLIDFSQNKYKSITIKYDKKAKYVLPDFVKEHYIDIFSSHQKSKKFNSNNLRLDNYSINGNKVVLEFSRTTYYDMLVTNLACDYEINNIEDLTLRQLYEPGPSFSSISESKLSNRFNVDFIYKTKDNYILLKYRDENMISAKKTFSLSRVAAAELFSENEITYKSFNNLISLFLNNNILKDNKVNERKLVKNVFNHKWMYLFRDIHHCGLYRILVSVNFDLTLDELLKCDSIDKEKIYKDDSEDEKTKTVWVWIKLDSFDFESFKNEELVLFNIKKEDYHIVKNGKDVIKKSKNHLNTTPGVAAPLYLYGQEVRKVLDYK